MHAMRNSTSPLVMTTPSLVVIAPSVVAFSLVALSPAMLSIEIGVIGLLYLTAVAVSKRPQLQRCCVLKVGKEKLTEVCREAASTKQATVMRVWVWLWVFGILMLC